MEGSAVVHEAAATRSTEAWRIANIKRGMKSKERRRYWQRRIKLSVWIGLAEELDLVMEGPTEC